MLSSRCESSQHWTPDYSCALGLTLFCHVNRSLEEMLLDDLLADTTTELDTSVTSLADTLVTTLI